MRKEQSIIGNYRACLPPSTRNQVGQVKQHVKSVVIRSEELNFDERHLRMICKRGLNGHHPTTSKSKLRHMVFYIFLVQAMLYAKCVERVVNADEVKGANRGYIHHQV